MSVVVLVPAATAVPKAPQVAPLLSSWSLVRRGVVSGRSADERAGSHARPHRLLAVKAVTR
jgi:hypothetical protein